MLTCNLSPAWCNIGADSPKDPAVERASLSPTDYTPIHSGQFLARTSESKSYVEQTNKGNKNKKDRERQKEEENKKTYFSEWEEKGKKNI